MLVGYSANVGLPKPWALMFTVSTAAATAIVALATASMLGGSERPLTEDITVLARLDDHTRAAGRGAANTVPSFLALPGKVGALQQDGRTVADVSELELQKGFCSPSIALLVRRQYPGAYDDWPDDKLELALVAKHPEYRDKLCVLPLWIGAAPHDIVKYELRPPPLAASFQPRALPWAALATAAFVLAALNAYYRFLGVPLERGAQNVPDAASQ